MNRITFDPFTDIPHQTSWDITSFTDEIITVLGDQNSLNNKISIISNLVSKAFGRSSLTSIHALLSDHLQGYQKVNLDTVEKLAKFIEPLFDKIRKFAQKRPRFNSLETACAFSQTSAQTPLLRLIPRIIQTQKINLNNVHPGYILDLPDGQTHWHLNLLSYACYKGDSSLISMFLQHGADANYGLHLPRATLPPALFINLYARHLEPLRQRSINTMLLNANATALVTYPNSEDLSPRWWLARRAVIEHCCPVEMIRPIIASIPDYGLAVHQMSNGTIVTVLDEIFNNTVLRNRFQLTDVFFSQLSELVTVLIHHGVYLSKVLSKLQSMTGRASPIDDKVRKLSKIVDIESGVRKLALEALSRKKILPIITDSLGSFVPKVLLNIMADYFSIDKALLTNPLIREIAEHCIPISIKIKTQVAKHTCGNNVF